MKYLRIDELISQNFGESSKNLIAFFKNVKGEIGKNSSYAYIIIDELDSFTFNRYQNDNESIKRILLTFNTIIDEMFINGDLNKIIIVATTNMRESIDTAVIRRFFFQEDFNIVLNKHEFLCFINNVKSVSNVFNTIIDTDIEELYNTYRKKKFTLGEMKTIFAHKYMDQKMQRNSEKLSILFNEESFYERIYKQKL